MPRFGFSNKSVCHCWLAQQCSALLVALLFASPAFAQQEDSWQPYRPTKLTRPEDNLRFRSSELGFDRQEIPPPRRTPARPGRLAPQEIPPPVETPPAGPPQREVEPSSTAPQRSSPPAYDFAQPLDPSILPQTNEYVDEFDIMPQTEELYMGAGPFAGPPVLTKYKDGFFQKLNAQATIVDPGQSSGFSFTEVETALTVALPAPTKDFPLLVTPIFEARFLDGPIAPDLPPTLYTTGVDFMWVPKVNDRLRGVISVAPMIYSDFQTNDSDMFRLTGKGIVQWDAIPDRLQLLAGVLYLNRDDIRLLPVAGLIWNPNAYWNLELIFPRPKIARLINYGSDYSDWIYVLGEFGGNSWAVQRDSGLQDKVTLRDVRALLGIERRRNGGANYRFEVGYVFAREIDYLSTPTADLTLDDTLLLRLGATF